MKDYFTEKFEIQELAPYIYCLRPFEGIELEVEDVMVMRKVFVDFSGGKEFGVLLDASNTFSPTPEAMRLLASKEFTALRFAAALVARTLPNKLVGNFFIQFDRPATPTRMFTDESDALEWLKEQQKKRFPKSNEEEE